MDISESTVSASFWLIPMDFGKSHGLWSTVMIGNQRSGRHGRRGRAMQPQWTVIERNPTSWEVTASVDELSVCHVVTYRDGLLAVVEVTIRAGRASGLLGKACLQPRSGRPREQAAHSPPCVPSLASGRCPNCGRKGSGRETRRKTALTSGVGVASRGVSHGKRTRQQDSCEGCRGAIRLDACPSTREAPAGPQPWLLGSESWQGEGRRPADPQGMAAIRGRAKASHP